MKNRLGALACSTSIGPGATNMITGAATATVNRLPGAVPAQRHLRQPPDRCSSSWSRTSPGTTSANDAFKAVSKYWDRINRPDQLPTALLEACAP